MIFSITETPLAVLVPSVNTLAIDRSVNSATRLWISRLFCPVSRLTPPIFPTELARGLYVPPNIWPCQFFVSFHVGYSFMECNTFSSKVLFKFYDTYEKYCFKIPMMFDLSQILSAQISCSVGLFEFISTCQALFVSSQFAHYKYLPFI